MIQVNFTLDHIDELHRRMAILESLVDFVGNVVEDEATGIALQTALWDVEKLLKPIKESSSAKTNV